MKRRNFLKGFLAATGTLAVAPALILEPVPVIMEPDISKMITIIKPDITPLEILCRSLEDFRAMRHVRINYLEGTEWKIASKIMIEEA
jgi:hypothetical protein